MEVVEGEEVEIVAVEVAVLIAHLMMNITIEKNTDNGNS